MTMKENGMSKEMMQDEKKSVLKKLNSRKGETISETLVALLISSLALTMLAGAITESANLVEKGRKKMDDYYTANESDADVIRMTGAGEAASVTIEDAAESDKLAAQSYEIVYYVNDEFDRTPVISYKADDE